MKKRWQLTFIVISFIFLSGFYYKAFIHWAIENDFISNKNIQFVKIIDKDAFHYIQYTKQTLGSNQWLTSSHFLAKSDGKVALALADHYLSLKQMKEAMLWYKQALQLGQSKAAQPIAQQWFLENLWPQSLSLAKQYNQYFWAQQLIVNIALGQGNMSDLDLIKDTLAETSEGQELLKQLNLYQVINKDTVPVIPQNSSCLSIQLFATSLTDLYHSSQLIKQIKDTEVGNYFCFNTPQYIPIDILDCDHIGEQAIRCNEAIWDKYSANITTRYLGVLLPSGGANVHSGILYLDSNDSVDVFKHELLHLLGFIDEYALPIEHPFCQSMSQHPNAHNIAVVKETYQGSRSYIRQQILTKIPWRHLIESTTPILYKSERGWKVGTSEAFKNKVGLFPVDTCKNSQLISVKPLAVQTTLAYNELPLPQVYKDFLKNDSLKYLMPSYHYNVSEALKKEGNKISAQAWLNRAKNF
ncbi:hypothetical protein [Thalassotalea profundi]|uniref:Sel1 repeat family protein n=1 Tax=Thalassotalea profundi TaxID=2036687 RepID=A0ABQ3IF46_9GAMM|nr:hypothetical protein [Thalassotalea profundi]GHE78851.1 hypothetical protein GCM10011501_03420 [Thalassotalea profundi]